MDISLNIYTLVIIFYTGVLNIPLEGPMSQIFDLGPGFYFMTKNGQLLAIFLNFIFKMA